MTTPEIAMIPSVGVMTSKATDWTIVYDDSDSYTLGVGYGWFGFILASKSAQRLDSFVFHGASFQFDVSLGKIVDRLRRVLSRANPPDPEKSFFPLKVMTAFSADDLDYADGRVFAAMVGENLVLRFHAGRTATRPDIGGYQYPAGRYFEHPAEGLPVPGQFPDVGFSGTSGTWRWASGKWQP